MKSQESKTIYTVGHSTHPLDEFLEMLQSFGIEALVDIRRLPGSRKYPQFDQENLLESLAGCGIQYIHATGLGGRRKANKDSKNTLWNNPSFRGYADYMETSAFREAAQELENLAISSVTVYMCSEAVWWRCHRSMVSDYLKARDWNVLHIMSPGKAQPHKYTAPALVKGNEVYYHDIP